MTKNNLRLKVFISIIIVVGIIDIILAIIMFKELSDVKSNTDNNTEIPEDFYISTVDYDDTNDNNIIIYDNALLIISNESIDINEESWLTVSVPTFEVILDIPKELVLNSETKVTNDDESNLELYLTEKYKLQIQKRELTSKEKELYIENLEEKITSRINLRGLEEEIGDSVTYSLSDDTHITISSFKEERLGEFGYRYTALRGNVITDITLTSPIEYMDNDYIVTYLKQFINMIRIVD